jgi:hypothetical protein
LAKEEMRLPTALHLLLPSRNFLPELFHAVQLDAAAQVKVPGFIDQTRPAATGLRCDVMVQDGLAGHFDCVAGVFQ